MKSRRKNDPLDVIIRRAQTESNVYLGCALSLSGLLMAALILIGRTL